jgi:2-isopropylmalate synthase
MREILGQTATLFTIQDFQVHCSILPGRDYANATQHHSLATIKIAVDGQNILEAAEGNGPVSALDAALRKALSQFYPELNKCYLTDYKVRIIDGGAGTSAVTRVLVESSNGLHRWTTIGVSDNILEASYQAVAQGIEYGLLVKSPQTCSLVEIK